MLQFGNLYRVTEMAKIAVGHKTSYIPVQCNSQTIKTTITTICYYLHASRKSNLNNISLIIIGINSWFSTWGDGGKFYCFVVMTQIVVNQKIMSTHTLRRVKIIK